MSAISLRLSACGTCATAPRSPCLPSTPADGIRKTCNKALWMVRGKVRMFGAADEVMDAYAYDRAMNHRSFISELLRHLAANKAFARRKAELRGRR